MRIKQDMDRDAAHKNRYLLLGMMSLLLGIACMVAARYYRISTTPSHFGAVDRNVLIELPSGAAPEDALYITQSRKTYKDSSMRLIIPALQLETEIGRSTEPEGLQDKPGLYEFAQLPGTGNVNVSVAGHRDIHGQEFYYLDKLAAGDSLYLVYLDHIYRYEFIDSKVVAPDAWEVIKPQGFSCLTLTTCDPIGTARNRLVVRAELADIEAYSSGYSFA